MQSNQECFGIPGKSNPPRNHIQVGNATGNGTHGTTSTKVRRFFDVLKQVGSGINYVDSAALGGLFKVLIPGIYSIGYHDRDSTNGASTGIVLNGTAQTTNVGSVTYAQGLLAAALAGGTTGAVTQVSWCGPLNAGDVITFNDNGSNNAASNSQCMAFITQVSV